MNLFLLTAVPLAAVAFHRLWYPSRPWFGDWKIWVQGSVWSLVALILDSYFGKWRDFSGDLLGAFLGLTFTDVLLVPGVVVVAWWFSRSQKDGWVLGLWLALAFSLAGVRDFFTTDRTYDLTELFLVPLDRILIVALFPELLLRALGQGFRWDTWKTTGAAGGLALTGSLTPVLSFAGWGWVDWVGLLGGLAAVVILRQKKAASQGSGSKTTVTTGETSISAGQPKQP